MKAPLFGIETGDWIAITVGGTEVLLDVRRVDDKRLDPKRVPPAEAERGRVRALHKGDLRGVNSIRGKRPAPHKPTGVQVGRDAQGNLRTAAGLVVPEGGR